MPWPRSEEHTSELQSQSNLVCRLLLEGYGDHRDLHSFPTRRSSDLAAAASDASGAEVVPRCATCCRRASSIFCRSATCVGCSGSPGICGMSMLVCATDMKLCHAMAGIEPPVTLFIGRKSSLPSHTPVTYCPLKPMNQASR